MDRLLVLLFLGAMVALATSAGSPDPVSDDSEQPHESVLSRLQRSSSATSRRLSSRPSTTSRSTTAAATRQSSPTVRKAPRIIHGPLVTTATDQEGSESEHYVVGDVDEPLVTAAQTPESYGSGHGGGGGNRRHGYSGTVVDGKSAYIMRYNQGVPIYGAGEPYYFSYTHNFPISVGDFENLVNSHNLPKKYKFSGGLDVTGLLEDHNH